MKERGGGKKTNNGAAENQTPINAPQRHLGDQVPRVYFPVTVLIKTLCLIKKCGYGSYAVDVDHFACKPNGRDAGKTWNWVPRVTPEWLESSQ
jgi:hypothetical protein